MIFKYNIGLNEILCSLSSICKVVLDVLCVAAAKVRCRSWDVCVYRLSIVVYNRSSCEV